MKPGYMPCMDSDPLAKANIHQPSNSTILCLLTQTCPIIVKKSCSQVKCGQDCTKNSSFQPFHLTAQGQGAQNGQEHH